MDRQYVGIDVHRRRSVIVRLSADGEWLGLHRIVNAVGWVGLKMAETRGDV